MRIGGSFVLIVKITLDVDVGRAFNVSQWDVLPIKNAEPKLVIFDRLRLQVPHFLLDVRLGLRLGDNIHPAGNGPL